MPRPVVPIFFAAQVSLGDLVDGDVVGRDQQMGVGGDQQPRGVHATVVEPLQLGEQHAGSTTTPLPMTLVTPGVRMPDGMRWRAKFSPTTVCPALLPPW